MNKEQELIIKEINALNSQIEERYNKLKELGFNDKELIIKKKLENILNVVCLVTNVSEEDIKSSTRKKDAMDARRVFFYTVKFNTNIRLAQMSKFLNRHHATAWHSINVMNDLLEYDKETKETVLKVNELLKKDL